jgi:hypothetical protein
VSQSQPNFSEMILGWSPFKNVSVSAVLYFSIFSLAAIFVGSRDYRTQFWKGVIQGSFHKSLVAIGSVVSEDILSQKVPKFELYKHNDELFNIYYGIFYEL